MNIESPILAVHLGAGDWSIDNDLKNRLVRLIRDALEEGYKAGLIGSSIDMVVEAISVLEDSGLVNAGLGSTVDISGNISMDAGIMYSGNNKAGAVAYVKYPRNPIRLARYVLENTDHVLIVGDAADTLAIKLGLEKHPGPLESVMKRYNEIIKKIEKGTIERRFYENSIKLWIKLGFLDTVGAIAKDKSNEFAAATSTGGVFLKLPGRVGDSSILGAGFYAKKCGAAAATGIGEYIIMSFLSLRVVNDICNGIVVKEAVDNAIALISSSYGIDTVGIIAMDRNGNVYGNHNTKAMPWGYIDSDKEFHIFV
uniref:Plant-type L-asparaginase n=1 Tax=Ignisphaera aggregans TaxID=334771 RepID=A0A7C4H845_9CREN